MSKKYENEFKEEFIVWGRSFELLVTFDVYDDEEVSEHQIKTYEDLKVNYVEYFDSVKDEIYEYVKEDTENEELPDNIFKFIIPKAIVIQREDEDEGEDEYKMEFALLCDYKYNLDDGISVSFENGESTGVGPEDVVL
jgi:hypothetical protein